MSSFPLLVFFFHLFVLFTWDKNPPLGIAEAAGEAEQALVPVLPDQGGPGGGGGQQQPAAAAALHCLKPPVQAHLKADQ